MRSATRTPPLAPWPPAGRVAVVRLRRPDEHPWAVDAALDALEAWLNAAGHAVVYRVWQRRRAPAASSYLGKGKALQLRALCRAAGVDAVVLDGTPTRAQRVRLEQLLDCPVVDRGQWARPRAGAAAAEGARNLHHEARRARGACRVVLVGCAGAGKSTLFSTLTRGPRQAPSWPPEPDAGRRVVTRRLRGAGEGPLVLVTDTPGLVWNPERGTWIVPAETDAERRAADLVLLVIDAAHPEAGRHARRVERLLSAPDAERRPPIIPVWTQIDRGWTGGGIDPGARMVSGRTGAGCDELIARLRQAEARP